MKKVLLDFHHKKFDDLSERSIRQFMRNVATSVRQAQLRELTDFIFAQDLDYAMKRSVADRLANASRDAPAYYVERIERGSLIALFSVSVAILAVIVHEPLIDLIDNEEHRRGLLENLRRYVRCDWAPTVANAIADQLDGRELGSHVVADRVRVKEGKSKIVVDVKLVTERDEKDPPRKPEQTLDSIERAIDRRLDGLDRRDR